MKLPILAAACLAAGVAACDSSQNTQDADENVDAAQVEPIAPLSAVDGFSLRSEVSALALLPSSTPWMGRGIAALAGGGLALLHLDEGTVSYLDGPDAGSLASAPFFQLRGSPAPLVIAAGGGLAAPAAFVYVEDGGALVEAPVEPIAPDLEATGVCLVRATDALVDIVVMSATGAEMWRVRDTGGELLTAERLEETPNAAGAIACASDGNGGVNAIDERRQLNGRGAGGAADITRFDIGGTQYALLARPDDGVLSAVENGAVWGRRFVVQPALNSPGIDAPRRLAASDANFGGAYRSGVILVGDGMAVTVLTLDQVRGGLEAEPADPTLDDVRGALGTDLPEEDEPGG